MNVLRKLQKHHENLVRQLTNHRTQSEKEKLEALIDRNESEQHRLSNKKPRSITLKASKRLSIWDILTGNKGNE